MTRTLAVVAAIVLLNLSVLAVAHRSGPDAVTVVIPRGTAHALYASSFEPAKITVVIGVNNTVRWVNLDDHVHMVTVDGVAMDHGGLEMGGMMAMAPLLFHGDLGRMGSTFTHTFQVEGNYSYHCPPHPWMRGYVEVVRADGNGSG
jgi:plastocyanin